MTLRETISNDIDDVFFNTDEFAISAVYNSKDGTITEKSIDIIFDESTTLQDAEYGAAGTSIAYVKKSDVSSPKIYDTITISGVIYTVRQRISGDLYVWTLSLESDERLQAVS
jgi:hypothetical protein